MNIGALLGIAAILMLIGFGIMGIGMLIARLNAKRDDRPEE